MATITGSSLDGEIEDAHNTLNHNIVELQKAESNVEELRELIAATKGAIHAYEYLLGKLEEEEPETPKPDDPDAKKVGEEA